MSEHDERFGAEDEQIARRLRDERPRLGGFELDRIKTGVMARVKPSGTRRAVPRSSILVALLTCGLMIGGTAGTIAASNSSFSGGTGAATSQYKPPKCDPKGSNHKCHCPGQSRLERGGTVCVCPHGLVFSGNGYDCRCPKGNRPVGGKCDPPKKTHAATKPAKTAARRSSRLLASRGRSSAGRSLRTASRTSRLTSTA